MTVETQILDQLFELQTRGFNPTHIILSEPMARKFLAEMREKHLYTRPIPEKITELKDSTYMGLRFLVKSNCELTYLEVVEIL
jgi:hypothetical protein